MKHTFLVSIILLLPLSPIPAMADTPAYIITDLGALGGRYSEARGINNHGQVVGYSEIPGDSARHAFLYDGIMHDLGTLGGRLSVANDINDSGHIVGHSRITVGSTVWHAFLYDGVMHDLGTLGGTRSNAIGINNIGQVVGSSDTSGGGSHGFVYYDSTMNDLGTLGGGWATAYDINGSGQIVGYSYVAGNANHAFLYDGIMHDLGTLGGRNSRAYGMNDHGQVVGYSHIPGDSATHAYLYYDDTMNDLGTLGGTTSLANNINNRGQVVGYSDIPGDSAWHAFLYEKGMMIDLNDLIASDGEWELNYAFDINDSGQIVGYGTINGHGFRAFLITPIPQAISVDIKPQSCPNLLNVKSKGVLPVAILGSDVYYVQEIDVTSLEILGVKPIKSSYEDVAALLAEEGLPEDCLCTTYGPDGYLDLTLKFETQEIIEAIGEIEDGDYVILTLTGSLMDGTSIEGTDCVLMLKKGNTNF